MHLGCPCASVVTNLEGLSKLESVIHEIQSEIEVIASSEALYEEANFNDRVEAIDFIEFDIVERIERLLLKEDQVQELAALK